MSGIENGRPGLNMHAVSHVYSLVLVLTKTTTKGSVVEKKETNWHVTRLELWVKQPCAQMSVAIY